MKHQVLARVFSVVLAILCLLLLATGVRGYDKAEKELSERRAYEEKFDGRIRSYVELEAELDGSISYEQAREELDKLVAQHEKDASQHRTDTALHTAEKGGNIQGADIIWELLPEVEGAKQELEEGKKLLAQKEAAFAKAKPEIEALVNDGVAACNAEKASLNALAAELGAYLAANPKPTLPEAPQKPTPPASPQCPAEPIDPRYIAWVEPKEKDFVTAVEPTAPQEPENEEGQEAYTAAMLTYEAEMEQYLTALAQQEAAYNAALEQYNQKRAEYEAALPGLVAEYEAALAAYPALEEAFEAQKREYEVQQAAYEAALVQYEADRKEYDEELYPAAVAALQTWQDNYNAKLAEMTPEIGQHVGAISALADDAAAAGGALAALAVELGGDAGSAGGLGAGGGGLSAEQLAMMPPEMLLAALPRAVDAVSAGYGQISAGLGQIGIGLVEASGQIMVAERELKKAEGELNTQLEMIWLNLGELEEQAGELAAEKEALDEEASVLSKKLLENEELKELTNRRNSARQLLLNVPEVKAESAESGDLPGAAEHYLDSYRARTQELYEGMRRVNLLSILGAAAGLLGIPGAFELVKKRFFLLAPVLLCLGFAAGAARLQVSLGLGQHYAALFTAIFAGLQFLIVLPKRKTPV